MTEREFAPSGQAHQSEQRLTPQRKAVLDAVMQSRGHLSAADIWERARALQPRISFATVYNAVHYLCEADLLMEIPFGNGASLYDARTDRHDHVICQECGRIADYDYPESRRIAADASQATGFTRTTVRIVLSGVCPECQKRTAPVL